MKSSIDKLAFLKNEIIGNNINSHNKILKHSFDELY